MSQRISDSVEPCLTLDNCADEPIHIPGLIQPHGALLVFDPRSFLCAWSENVSDVLGITPGFGQSTSDLSLDPDVLSLVRRCRLEMKGGEAPSLGVAITLKGRLFDCIVHGHQNQVLVEFEPRAQTAEFESYIGLSEQGSIERLRRQHTLLALLQTAVLEIREITGFDRVMAYQFRADDSGEVVAETHCPGLTPYLGQRYPASDIPAQARSLYIINRLRVIADVSYRSVKVIGRFDAPPLDMSHSVLRSVSPIHVEYLHNMGVGASMSISIVIDGRLWGLIACHHMGARHIPYPVRMDCDVLAYILASMVQNVQLSADANLLEEAVAVRAGLIETLQRTDGLLPMLHQHAPALCKTFGADALIFAQHGELLCFGDVSESIASVIVESLPKSSERLQQRDCISQWPEHQQALIGTWVGLLAFCFDPFSNGWIVSLRREQIETVRWGGQPQKYLTAGKSGHRLTPRGSFDEWRETVRGQCEPWSGVELSIARQLQAEIHRLRNAELTRRATHDELTGLPNRAFMLERIGNALKRSQRHGLEVALLFVDLDRFKLINDTHGHTAGDFVLTAIAERLVRHIRVGETVGRLSGDEFVILCEQINESAEVGLLAGRINDVLRVPIDYKGLPIFVTASIGIALGRGDLHTADELLGFADEAMYAVKKSGCDGHQFFDEAVHAQVRQHLRISNGLRVAIEQHELSVRYQPIVIADTGKIVGAELLLRWNPPEGEVSPAIFIPIAETTRIMVPIGAWVFQQACRTEVAWRLKWGEKAPYVSVNVSARQLNEDSLPADFAALIAESQADPSRLLLEITETTLMTDLEANLRVLHQLAALGLRIAVDDFGTGYSSLAQLTRLPVDVLKIDREFVNSVGERSESRTVVRAIIGLGHALGLKVVAEGVETAAQQLELSAYGCDFIQGYYFHRPATLDAFVDIVDKEHLEGTSIAIEPLHLLIYVSTSVNDLSPEAVKALVESSAVRNQAIAVTGCLLYHDGYFMQMLEGSKTNIHRLFSKIRSDPRHSNVHVVIEAAATRRIFTGWGMVRGDRTKDISMLDFRPWQRRSMSFLEIAEDARTCHAYIAGHVPSQLIREK
jgi:diguanylate cyclase (GGDEF)-like protein